jgi:phage terminase large subunit-like protein
MNDYIEKVLSGELVAPKKIIQACERHINDLERSKSDSFPYVFDEEQATKAIKFMQLLPATNGDKIDMLGFQKFIIGSLYGWRTKENDYRRFNRALISMARKNGKTYLVSGLGANALILEKEPAKEDRYCLPLTAISKLNWAMICYLIHLETWSSLVSF